LVRATRDRFQLRNIGKLPRNGGAGRGGSRISGVDENIHVWVRQASAANRSARPAACQPAAGHALVDHGEPAARHPSGAQIVAATGGHFTESNGSRSLACGCPDRTEPRRTQTPRTPPRQPQPQSDARPASPTIDGAYRISYWGPVECRCSCQGVTRTTAPLSGPGCGVECSRTWHRPAPERRRPVAAGCPRRCGRRGPGSWNGMRTRSPGAPPVGANISAAQKLPERSKVQAVAVVSPLAHSVGAAG